jgi:hypothetical protein
MVAAPAPHFLETNRLVERKLKRDLLLFPARIARRMTSCANVPRNRMQSRDDWERKYTHSLSHTLLNKTVQAALAGFIFIEGN